MRIIDTTQIVDPNVEQPLLGASLDFLTQNQLETLQAVCRAFIGPSYSSTQVYVLWGCVFSNPSAYAMTAGAIFYNGEIYQVNSASALGNDLTKIFPYIHNDPTTTDPYTGSRALDPVTFSDGVTTGNVHITNYYTVASALGGTSPASGWKYINTPTLNVVGAAGQPAFAGSWAAGTSNRLAFWKTPYNTVKISGAVKGGTTASTIFTLPSGYLPAYEIGFAAFQTGTANTSTCTIDTSGNVAVAITGGALTGTDNVYINIEFPLS